MPRKLKEYEKHVNSPYSEHGHETSLCGKDISMEFHFVNISHLFAEREREGRLLPCPECLKIIIKTLKS